MPAAPCTKRPLLLCLGLLGVVVASGCSRHFYRTQADREASCLIEEKSNDPRWALPDFTIEMDPRSRYADVYNPDRPPMPPDDPASHVFMHCVDGMKQYDGWHKDGDITELENPYWKQCLVEYATYDEEGNIRLTLEEAMRLALMHSPDYQEQLETLYLSALDVSTERFRFDVQFFGGNFTQFQHLGEERAGGESNQLSTDTDFTINRRFATAGELLVGFANSFTWEFFGPNTNSTISILDFAFVQPLLRAGGRAFALEQLTIAERALLGNLRAFQRYRQGFYTELAIGESGVSGPRRRGGFFGGTGLTGFTGQGSGGFGGVGDATGFGRSFGGGGGATGGGGGAGFAGGGAGVQGGFIGLLQQLQQIRNTEDSLELQLRMLAFLESSFEAGTIDIGQVNQFRQNIETERANLLQARNALQSSLDNFKRDKLGLPPNLPLALDDSMIQQFQLIDPAMNEVQNAITAQIDQFGGFSVEPTDEKFVSVFEQITTLHQRVLEQLNSLPKDLARLDEQLPERIERLTPAERRLTEYDRKKMDEEIVDLRERHQASVAGLETLRGGLNDETREETADAIVELLRKLSDIVGELSLVQARARLERITIEPVEIAEGVALEVARANRLDWMNNRAALVDTWRLITFNANALRSDLTIRFDGDFQTLGGDNPVKFRDETGALRASVEFDPPFTRLIERNNFRQQLIEYQQDRRQLIQFEDEVLENIRNLLRNLELQRVNLEIQRRAVAIAVQRVDFTREELNKPFAPIQPGQPPATFGPTAAQDLLFALSDVRNTQNILMSVWLNYYATRMRLYRELGVMQVDDRNLWIDVSLDELIGGACPCPEPLPPAVPQEWFQELEVPVPPEPAEDGPEMPAPGPATLRDRVERFFRR